MEQGIDMVAGDHIQLFESWYHKLDPQNSGSISADSAAQFLKKSDLNDNLLSRIWDLSDPGGKGYFDKAGLFVALKLVALVQNGGEPSLAAVNTFTPPPNMGEAPPHPAPPHPAPPHQGPPHPGPPHPPPPIARSPGPPLVPAPPAPSSFPSVNSSGVWTITPADRGRYDQIFNSLGPEANKIHGNKVRGVMINSKLPTETLGKIWDLADMDKDGSLDRVEFSIAMHLIYKVLENNSLPITIPQEMLSSARRAGVAGQGPVPAPLAPPSQVLVADNNKLQSSGPPPAPWVVTAADKARYDLMFHNADLDKDGFVSGQEIKGVFLQSGLPQMVLAHIWNICDMKQTGKLTSEQFALAMWLIQQKIAGVDPPSILTPEMIPPTMRPKPATEQPVVAKPTYNNPELQAIADEIEELGSDKLKLEADIQQKESSIRLKNNEIKNLQTELDTLSATLRQLENQKGAAQKRLDDLGQQKDILEQQLREHQEQILAQMEEVESLRVQVEEQESSLQAQEEEVLSKQKELNDLRSQELELEASVLSFKNKIQALSSTQQETLLYLSQVKNKISELQDQEHHMTEVITSYDAAIAAGDGSTLSESFLVEVHPHFQDPLYMAVGPQSPTVDPLSPVLSPVNEPAETNGTLSDAANDNTLKAKDTSFVGGHDPFAQAFGGAPPTGDPFAVWDSSKSNAAPAPPPASVDPFGGDAFVAKSAPAAKKSKAPPPRPAPPKTRPAKPPPPQYNSNNNPTSSDPFGGGGGGWSDPSAKEAKVTKNGAGGFADFANFSEFDNKYSSANAASSSKSPWGDSSSSSSPPRLRPAPSKKPPSPRARAADPFFSDSFGSSTTTSASSWGGVTSSGEGEAPPEARDPFGGDYDPFKNAKGVREAEEEFSWDDEADALFSDSGLGSGGGGDPFAGGPGEFSPLNQVKNALNTSSSSSSWGGLGVGGSAGLRSKSALGDPILAARGVPPPTRSKTSLGAPGNLDFDFDPLSSSKSNFNPHKSNEDLLNENFLSPTSPFAPTNPTPTNATYNNNNNNKINKNNNFGRWPSDVTTRPSADPWPPSSKAPPVGTQEQADLELALALSRSLVGDGSSPSAPL